MRVAARAESGTTHGGSDIDIDPDVIGDAHTLTFRPSSVAYVAWTAFAAVGLAFVLMTPAGWILVGLAALGCLSTALSATTFSVQGVRAMGLLRYHDVTWSEVRAIARLDSHNGGVIGLRIHTKDRPRLGFAAPWFHAGRRVRAQLEKKVEEWSGLRVEP